MAWYRCGGGGLPAGLQSDMDIVLNKKFSTSTTYPPTDWPDTVNLMGPLPEKTASGAIAHIEDGADSVPLKNWLVTLPASLTGYTAIHGRKNTGTGTPETQYLVALGQTVYCGTADIATGEGSADGAVITLDDTMSYGINLGTDTNRIAVTFYNSVGKINGTFASNVLTVGENASGGYKNEPWVVWGSTSAARMWISVPTSIDTVDKFKQYLQNNTITIAYELATSTAFTFTPITPTPNTALGTNNFWADEGDSDVTYRADISLALQALGGGGRGLMGMMMRPTEPEETEETEETEGLEDELNR